MTPTPKKVSSAWVSGCTCSCSPTRIGRSLNLHARGVSKHHKWLRPSSDPTVKAHFGFFRKHRRFSVGVVPQPRPRPMMDPSSMSAPSMIATTEFATDIWRLFAPLNPTIGSTSTVTRQ